MRDRWNTVTAAHTALLLRIRSCALRMTRNRGKHIRKYGKKSKHCCLNSRIRNERRMNL